MGGSHGLDDLLVFGSLDGYGRLTQGLDGPVGMDGACGQDSSDDSDEPRDLHGSDNLDVTRLG